MRGEAQSLEATATVHGDDMHVTRRYAYVDPALNDTLSTPAPNHDSGFVFQLVSSWSIHAAIALYWRSSVMPGESPKSMLLSKSRASNKNTEYPYGG